MSKHILQTVMNFVNGAATAISSSTSVAGHRPVTSSVRYTTNCNTQSSAPEDG